MERRKAGRPKQQKLVSIDRALLLVREHLIKKGVDESEVDRMVPAKKTIYNKISGDILHNHGSRQCVLLDEAEVYEKLCS